MDLISIWFSSFAKILADIIILQDLNCMPSYVTRPQIFISTLYSSYNWSLFIEIVFMPTINTTYSILFVRSFHHHLFTLSKRTHYIIRSISQVIILVLSELVTPEVLQRHSSRAFTMSLKQPSRKWEVTIEVNSRIQELMICVMSLELGINSRPSTLLNQMA